MYKEGCKQRGIFSWSFVVTSLDIQFIHSLHGDPQLRKLGDGDEGRWLFNKLNTDVLEMYVVVTI